MPSYKLNATVAVEVGSLDSACRFYKGVLGMSEISRDAHGCSLKKGDMNLFVMSNPAGHVWLSLTTDDLDGAKTQLETSGCKVTPVPSGYLVVDPYGTRFYLTSEGK